jgi:hypothetical protein
MKYQWQQNGMALAKRRSSGEENRKINEMRNGK